MILVAAVMASIISIAALIQVWRLSLRLQRVLGQSTSGDRLEKQLREYHAKNKAIQTDFNNLVAEHQLLKTVTARSLQNIAMVRFNPFGDVGSDQSFSLALLDGHQTGLIITSIHGRGGTRIYSKPIEAGKSQYTLSTEEKQALIQAKEGK